MVAVVAVNSFLIVPERPSKRHMLRRVHPSKIRNPEHVLFTTHGNKPGYEEAYRIAQDAVNHMPVRSLFFTHTRKNQYGYPYIKDMYLEAMQMFPFADTYTYYNSDILFNGTEFLRTVDALVEASRSGVLSSRFLAVGYRRNVRWNVSTEWDELVGASVRFQDDAQDFFIASNGVWDWSAIPDLVIGRRAYDNWLVQRAVRTEGVDAVDVSATLTALHLTVRGNMDGHEGTERDNVDFNMRVIETHDPKWSYFHGRMSACPKRTRLNSTVVVIVI